ncbi:MAG: nuclear transport factor 2 family protein [Gammaproteobacteria bacterium]|nr:nuclear transport factor 2 family protein [Gammaproteobacteria bacterium]
MSTRRGPLDREAPLSAESDRQQVASLDLAFQRAVKHNDVERMASILHEDMVLILGDGRRQCRADLLEEARQRQVSYELQDEEPDSQVVRVCQDTAVVTACLKIAGHTAAGRFQRRVWFSDVYVRTESGWRYYLGQASLPMPERPPG